MRARNKHLIRVPATVTAIALALSLLELDVGESFDSACSNPALDCWACCEQEARRIPVTNRIARLLDVNHVAQFGLNLGLSLVLFNAPDFLITVCPFFRSIRTNVKSKCNAKKIRVLSKTRNSRSSLA